MTEQQDDELLRVTAQYVSEWQAGKKPGLSAYQARYPAYATAIADFVAYYCAIEAQAPDDLTVPASLSLASLSVLERLQAQEQETASPAPVTASPVTPGNRGCALSQIAQAIDLTTDIVFLLENRAIDLATVPNKVIARLAAVSGVSPGRMKSYLTRTAAPCRSSTRTRLKVAERDRNYDLPATDHGTLPSFRQVVAASDMMDEEQKKYWLTLLAQEGL